MAEARKPVVLTGEALGDTQGVDPGAAPAVPDLDGADRGAAMVAVTRIAARRPNRLARLFWASLSGLLVMMIGLAAFDFVATLLARNIWLGRLALLLGAAAAVTFVALVLRELAGLWRLSRLDGLRREVEAATRDGDKAAAEAVARKLSHLYEGRPDLRWSRQDLDRMLEDQFDADGVLSVTETRLMAPLDAMARREVEAAARTVAAATALVPLALADVAVAMGANIRMIRRLAEVYGGRAGTLGSLRLLRAVAAHLLATGAVAVGDDMISSIAGGSALSRVSRRFGEGVINGTLTARVGVAAIEVCRPMPFAAQKRPSVTGIVKRALTGLFSREA
ncbi:YcjF family protein [Oceanomicrobium pacificus]|uniref:TIGR01620 family protein n=1 Tax=Oceanomicrobium pacificus TaxID=2692916 RepID=A0A6B0TZE6_9RHOB|nr:TIGR01620 family protein [Oceanomicrobium pacificus]MXU64271.1 TIGR01620 family protein [Oceanomicrobium pacificus]